VDSKSVSILNRTIKGDRRGFLAGISTAGAGIPISLAILANSEEQKRFKSGDRGHKVSINHSFSNAPGLLGRPDVAALTLGLQLRCSRTRAW
jgi:hypothetical protein